MSRQKTSVKEKVTKELPDFANDVASLNSDQINSRLAQLVKDVDAIESAKEEDEGIEEARSVLLERSAPYRDAKKVLKLKTRYLIALLKDQGAL